MPFRLRHSQGERLRIIVAGYIVRGPLGGLVWHHLQYVLGLRQLGHQVLFVEDSGDDEWSCYDPERGVTDDDCSYGLRWTAHTFEALGRHSEWAFYNAKRSEWHGPMGAEAANFCRQADLLLNLSGSNVMRPWLAEIPVRAYVDTDPVFTQVRNLTEPDRHALTSAHNRFLTFGENVGSVGGIPDDGFPWLPTRQPIVLDAWTVVDAPASGPYTTVMQWSSYHSVEFQGRRYGMKSDSFEELKVLPSRVAVSLEVALGSVDAPRDELIQFGWRVVDPLHVARHGDGFRSYVASSRGEFAVAKHGYVVSGSGWFSERSANYLASGRPVVTQDTGFTAHLPVGEGLIAYSTLEEAVEALAEIERDHDRHSRAAREVAQGFFDSNNVLDALLNAIR